VAAGIFAPMLVRLAIVAAALSLALPGVAAAQDPNPLFQNPGISPPGANDPSCKPSQDHPNPVVLVHGTYADMTVSWNLISPALVNDGYCVFALDYGHRATQPVQHSAKELRRFVHQVLRVTGAHRVSMVGHSQGGMMPRYFVKFLGGADEVNDLVGLAPSNHGTTTPAAEWAGQYGSCPACIQQEADSNLIKKLNKGDETPGKVSYTQVETSHDEIVTPFKSAFLEPGPRTTNVLLQDACPADPAEHVSIIYDPVALQWIENALGRHGSADPDFDPTC
jgi:triacylglycerol lipase